MPNIMLFGADVEMLGGKTTMLITSLSETSSLTDKQKKNIVITQVLPVVKHRKPIAVVRMGKGTDQHLIWPIESICRNAGIAIDRFDFPIFEKDPVITFYGLPLTIFYRQPAGVDLSLLQRFLDNPLKTNYGPVLVRSVQSRVINLNGENQPYAEVKPADAGISPVSYHEASCRAARIVRHVTKVWGLDVEYFHNPDPRTRKAPYMKFHPAVK